jgi:hypothetical protein
MLRKSSQHAFTGLALAIVVSLGAQSAAAKPLQHRHHIYAMDRGPYYAPAPAALPHTPEYGFLSHVPANAIRRSGYTFVPGVGILGESCDLPTSACTNEYRDTQ